MSEEQKATILIVDDEEMVTTALRSFLQLATSYRILTYTTPREALQAVDDEFIDVVIADFLMPEMDGIAFLKAVRERRPEATRILLTGYADKENAIRAINEAGLYYYLEKPWDNDHLQVVIRNGVERAALFREIEIKAGELESAHDDLAGLRKRLIQAFV
ncbi:MAG: response regulator [Gemmatimonadota bacterium]|nr:MAG: response regulator [Gemmatimonadota bacterium]